MTILLRALHCERKRLTILLRLACLGDNLDRHAAP